MGPEQVMDAEGEMDDTLGATVSGAVPVRK